MIAFDPAQTALSPVISPIVPSNGFTVIAIFTVSLAPQSFKATTFISPDFAVVAKSTTIESRELVPTMPVGNVQLYEVAFATGAILNTFACSPAQTVVEPVI